MKRTRQITAAASALVIGALGVTALPAAHADSDRERTVRCTSGATAKLSLDREHRNRIDAEFEVDHAAANQRWSVRLKHNGTTKLVTQRMTDRDGEFDVSRRVKDRPGTDRVKVVARSTSGQVCKVTVRI